MTLRGVLCLFLVSVPACGDLIGYPLRHRPTSPAEQPAPVYPGSVSRPSTSTVFDGSVPSWDLDPNPGPTQSCRWPPGADLMSFCSGTAPRAVTDNKVLALQGVRAKGSVPRFHSRFHFVLADGPRQLLAELATGEMSGEIGQFDLSAESTAWEARVFKVLCDADLSCTIPKDWLSVAKGDEVLGWLEVKKHSAALCLAVIRGANHPTSPGLPCTTLLYTPAIPLE